MSSSPPPIPPRDGARGDSYFPESRERDSSNDEKISILDPRRFTPTLHASLVSEILTLRREVESKNSLVLSLEETLLHTKNENTKLSTAVAANAQENRSMKRQMEMLEGGTLSALEEVAKERDQAVENLADIRKRLDSSQRKVRAQEEEANRSQSLWESDKERWMTDKRNLDRKVHVAENRLQTILAEVEAANVDRQHEEVEAQDRVGEIGAMRSQSSASHRRYGSTTSNGTQDSNDLRSMRFSHTNGMKGSALIGATLAEELDFDNMDEAELDDSDIDAGYMSPEALPEEAMHRPRPFSAQSSRDSTKARKLLGLSVGEGDRSPSEEIRDPLQEKGAKQMFPDSQKPNASVAEYTSTATQFSPPPSPRLQPARDREGVHPVPEIGHTASSQATGGTRVMDAPSEQTSTAGMGMSSFVSMVSQACQTLGLPPLSPPDTPITIDTKSTETDRSRQPVEMKIASTQTDSLAVESGSAAASTREESASQAIPTIAIHPPVSEHITSRSSVVLPPHTKNVACQAAISPVRLRSVSVQTEEIRIDNRPVKLPPHLLPSSISSNPPSPSSTPQPSREIPTKEKPQQRRASSRPRRPSPRQTSSYKKESPPVAIENHYPGNNDNGPLNVNVNNTDIRRPIRSESLFAGFDDADDVENQMPEDADYSDDSFGEQGPIRKTLSKVQDSWRLVPQTTDSVRDRLESERKDVTPQVSSEAADHRSKPKEILSPHVQPVAPGLGERKAEKTPRPIITSRQSSDIRRAAMISSGTAVHASRPRSPSAPLVPGSSSTAPPPPAPPFPVPTRASSRRIPLSVSEGARSPTPQSTSFFSGGQARKEHGRPPVKRPVLRKIRSAAAAAQSPQDEPYRKRSRSPPPPPRPDSIVSHSPQDPPPLPKDDITSPHRPTFGADSSHRRQDSTGAETATQQTSVVDAIAQTMIGEWMWKYVRKRKSFGIGDAEIESGRLGSENGSVNGIRHKRWVWLAPYERAILWSSKQPTSGSALMGKSGRKRKAPVQGLCGFYH